MRMFVLRDSTLIYSASSEVGSVTHTSENPPFGAGALIFLRIPFAASRLPPLIAGSLRPLAWSSIDYARLRRPGLRVNDFRRPRIPTRLGALRNSIEHLERDDDEHGALVVDSGNLAQDGFLAFHEVACSV